MGKYTVVSDKDSFWVRKNFFFMCVLFAVTIYDFVFILFTWTFGLILTTRQSWTISNNRYLNGYMGWFIFKSALRPYKVYAQGCRHNQTKWYELAFMFRPVRTRTSVIVIIIFQTFRTVKTSWHFITGIV